MILLICLIPYLLVLWFGLGQVGPGCINFLAVGNLYIAFVIQHGPCIQVAEVGHTGQVGVDHFLRSYSNTTESETT